MPVRLCLSLLLLTSAASAADRPNILFIVCDDLNTHVSSSGYEHIHTPTFDELAASGTTFTRAFCQYPVCGPSRASFLSGLYPESTGILDNTSDIRQTRPDTITMPQFFKEHGYWTAKVGKVFHNSRTNPGELAWSNNQPRYVNDELPVVTAARLKFEQQHGSIDLPQNRRRWRTVMKDTLAPLNAQTPPGHGRSGLQDEQHKDGKNARQVLRWLQNKDYGDRPFFITLGIQKPHVPYLAPDKYFDMYPPEKIPFFRNRSDLWDSLPKDAAVKRYESFGFELGVENPSRRREFMQAYHACITFIDAQIGLVTQELKQQGLWDNTIIILTSDHGYHLGDHFLWGKVTLFDIGAKVPFLVRAPGVTTPGSHSEAMVELVDVFPTLADLADLPAPAHLQGVSLKPQLLDPASVDSRDYAYSVVTRGQKMGYAIRSQHWRFGSWPSGEELYDLKADPHERHNLAAVPDHQQRLIELRAALKERQQMARGQR
ncbi:MAG: sulfatase [Planctomycetaceae bacterium]|nr:sulfatase [Planctomycetaceae bacterium]